MIVVDSALKAREAEGRPVRVGLIGAGFMGRGIVHQILNFVPGMRLVAVANRTAEKAIAAYRDAGAGEVVTVATDGALADAIARGRYAVTDNAELLCAAESIDVLIESTGHVGFGADVTLQAITGGKHLVSMNAELDGTVGPLLKYKADQAGVLLSGCDGDQPGVQMNLLRFVQSIGLRPLVCGNIKGLQDRYRNPTTQESFARQWGQTPSMVTSFADGTKISFEQAIVANATGMVVSRRGMNGFEYEGHIDDMVDRYDVDELRALGGIVDYVVGPKPSPGVYVFAELGDDPTRAHYLDYGKLGNGPLYSFYVPYHLTVFEVPLTAARLALLGDVAIAPLAGPVVDVIAVAKRNLKAGETLDGLGGYMTYGMCENTPIGLREQLLPIGLAEGAVLKHAVAKDTAITYADVTLPEHSLVCQLRAEQDRLFA